MANFEDEEGTRAPHSDSGSRLSGDQVADLDTLVAEVDLDPGSAAFPTLAEAFRRAGSPERARTIAEVGLERTPGRLAGRVALALALLDLGESAEASRQLATILQEVPSVPADFGRQEKPGIPSLPDASHDERISSSAESLNLEVDQDHPEWATPLAEPSTAPLSMTAPEVSNELGSDEIDEAFASAAPDPDGMLDVNEIAPDLAPDLATGGGDGLEDDGHADGHDGATHPSRRAPYETETMASLLEIQGDREGADEIRAQLSASDSIDGAVQAGTLEVGPAAQEDESDRILATLDSWLENIRRKVA